MDCAYNPNGHVSFVACDIKRISRNNVRVNLQVNFSRPVYSVHVHTVPYRKFTANVYRKFLNNLWEDACGWLNHTAKSYLLDYTVGRALKSSRIETNVNKCPLTGNVYIKSGNYSLDSLIFDHLLPAGRYRVEVTFFDKKNGEWIFRGNVYVSVSDIRVEIF